MRQQLEAARNERQATADSLASSQQAVERLTDTLQGVSDARDRMEEQITSCPLVCELKQSIALYFLLLRVSGHSAPRG